MPSSPQFTLTANLEAITGQPAGSTDNPARLVIYLANYGLYLPCVPGVMNLSRVVFDQRSTGAPIAVPLWGNDLISPAGTYYAIAVYDGEDNLVQCAAYSITGSGTFDLSTLTPLGPAPTPPLPPPINAELEIVTGNPPVFHANTYLSFKLTLTQSYGSSSIVGGVAGNLYCFSVLQDGAGGHTLAWPANTYNFPPLVGQTPNQLTIVTAMCDENGHFNAAGLGTEYDPAA